jgi:hypothetical protein
MWNEFPVEQLPEKEKEKKKKKKKKKRKKKSRPRKLNQGLPAMRLPKANAKHCQRSHT